MSTLEMSGLDFGLGLVDQSFRTRIAGIEGSDLRLKPLIVGCDLAQRLAQLVVGNVLILADNLQELLCSVLSDAKGLADLHYAIDQVTIDRRFDRRL